MSKIGKDIQKKLLDDLCNLGFGQSEAESPGYSSLSFYPVPEHLRAFEPDVTLVVGDRGTGKTTLFNAVFKNDLLPALARITPNLLRTYNNQPQIHWVMGYPIGKDFPDYRELRNVMQSPAKAIETWFAYLVRVLQNELKDPSLNGLYEIAGGDPEAVLAKFSQLGNKPLLAVDALDRELEKTDRWLFIGYDELDTLGGTDWDAMIFAARGLLGFWSNYMRRWRRIRAKIFLRSDLFRRHSGMGSADFAKLAANRVELQWSDKNLFAMLIKRIANKTPELHNYCLAAKIPFKKQKDEIFGYIPDLTEAEAARSFIERLIGRYMGANKNKGQSFNWVLDHLRDGKKRITPRLLVRLFEQAGEKERFKPQASSPHLYHPVSLRQALDDVSSGHVGQAYSEWPWLEGVKTRIKEQALVPWTKVELEKLLNVDWDKSWSTDNAKSSIRPPAVNPGELIEYLIELGIFRERPGQTAKQGVRIDVPDIYLYGLGLSRKGGVKRR